MAVGLAFLAATLDGGASSAHSSSQADTLALYVAGGGGLGALAVLAGREGRHAGVVLAVAAGLTWGASDVSIKALSHSLHANGALVLIDPLALVIAGLSLWGLLISARSLQLGEAVPVIAVTSATANVMTIAAGPIVFGEPLPGTALGVTVRLLAFMLAICAAAMTPAPVRAARADPVAAPVR